MIYKLKKEDHSVQEYIENHPRLLGVRLNSRYAFVGGCTENFVTAYEVGDEEEISYIDILSLYPGILNYGMFQLLHPKIYVGEEYVKKEYVKNC